VHGASEASRFYFAKDPAELTLDEGAVPHRAGAEPEPLAYARGRAGRAAALGARADGVHRRKMNTRSVLAPELVPAAESLHVELRGAAAALLAPAGPTPPPVVVPGDSVADGWSRPAAPESGLRPEQRRAVVVAVSAGAGARVTRT
jgi:hypothetical protein